VEFPPQNSYMGLREPPNLNGTTSLSLAITEQIILKHDQFKFIPKLKGTNRKSRNRVWCIIVLKYVRFGGGNNFNYITKNQLTELAHFSAVYACAYIFSCGPGCLGPVVDLLILAFAILVQYHRQTDRQSLLPGTCTIHSFAQVKTKFI